MELYTNHMFLGANAYGMEAGRNVLRQTSKRSDTRRSSAARRNSESAERLFATSNPGEGKRTPRSRAGSDGEKRFRQPGRSRRRKAKPIQLADTAYYQSQHKVVSVRLSGRVHSPGARRQVHDARRPGRSSRLHDHQRRSAEESLRSLRAGLRTTTARTPAGARTTR
jgi:hypothetical protein